MDAPKSLSDTYYHSQEIQQDVKAHGSDSIGVAPSHHGEEVLTSPFGVDSGANEKQTEHVANPRSNPTRARRVIRKMERGWRRFLRPQSGRSHLKCSNKWYTGMEVTTRRSYTWIPTIYCGFIVRE